MLNMCLPQMVKSHLPVTAVILAGGRGIRIGGDKGLQVLQGKSLISWVLASVKHDCVEVLINTNSAQAAYADFGCRVIADTIPDWPGPLGGLHAALLNAKTEYVLTVPCDTPFLPDNLISRLSQELNLSASEAAVAVSGGSRQPTIALYRLSVLPKLLDYLDSGGRKVNDWLDCLRLSEVVFDNVECFDNINSREDLAEASQKLAAARGGVAEKKR